MSETTEALTASAESYREVAAIYRNYAKQFELGSLGWVGNNAEADKYDELATRFGGMAGLMNGAPVDPQ